MFDLNKLTYNFTLRKRKQKSKDCGREQRKRKSRTLLEKSESR